MTFNRRLAVWGAAFAVALATASAVQAAPPAGWTQVALENAKFVNTASRAVQYGANSSWITKTLAAGTQTCKTSTFGSDPAPGVRKSCYINLGITGGTVPDSGTFLAKEAKFTLPASTAVQFGVTGKVVNRTLAAGEYLCGPIVFGSDPAPGETKSCYSLGAGGTTGGTTPPVVIPPTVTPPTGPGPYLATQGGSFGLTKLTRVSYGVDGVYVQADLAAGTRSCVNATFPSDPSPTKTKYCYSLGDPPAVVNPPATTTPSVFLAGQSGSFTLLTTTAVKFGRAPDAFYQKTLPAGTYTCQSDFFGDPPDAIGLNKSCYTVGTDTASPPQSPNQSGTIPVVTTPPSSTFLSAEAGRFEVTKLTAVKYGVTGKFYSKTLVPGSYPCTAFFFGDPAPTDVKACYLVGSDTSAPTLSPKQAGTTNTNTQIAAEFYTFNLTETTNVRWGLNDKWYTKTLTAGNNIECLAATFDNVDPAPGPEKVCEKLVEPNTTTTPTTPTTTTTYTQIAAEFYTFNLSQATTVRWGLGNNWYTKVLQAGTNIKCEIETFDNQDPAPSAQKVCQSVTTGTNTVPTGPVSSYDVSNDAVYRQLAAAMGTDEGIKYRYGSPSTAATPSNTYPGPRPNKSYLSLSVQRGEVLSDGVVGGRGCGYNGWCGEYQIGNVIGWPGDYSSNIVNVGYIPDATPPAGFPEARYFGVGSFQTLNVGHNTISWKPEVSWTTYAGPNADDGANDENTVRLAGVRGGSPIGTIELDGKPVASVRGYGRGGWTNNTLTVFANGAITSSGSNTSHNFLKYKLPSGKVPTGAAITNSGEFMLITVWDTAALKGQVAVLALSDACQWCETKPESEWNANWGGHTRAYPGLPGLGNYFQAKLVGYVDLPANMRAPTEVAVTTGKYKGGYDGYERIQNFFEAPLDPAQNRANYYNGDWRGAIPRTGMAVVLSKSEKKAAFIDLRPLFMYYREQYLNKNDSQFQALIANRGQAPNQWPYTFDVEASQKPTLIKVVDFTNAPTAVQMSRNAPHRALIATEEGTMRVFDLGSKYLDQTAATTGVATDIVEKFTITGLGSNPTSIAYVKEKARFSQGNKSLLWGDNRNEEQFWWILSRGERKATMLQFDSAFNSGSVFKTVQDSHMIDPIAVQDGDNHGTESYLLTVADYSGKKIYTYAYGPIVMWTYDNKAPCTGSMPCAPANGATAEFAGEQALPGKPFSMGLANIN